MQETHRSAAERPHIDCVVIGVNASATLARCLQSIRTSNYPQNALHIYYVDGGSHDESLAIATSIPGVTPIALDPEYPTPGLGRNAGWRAGNSPLVHFFDSDTIVHPDWFTTAVASLRDEIAAVRGNREEMFPDKTVYNWIGNLEWNDRPGDVESFGGDVLVRRSVLEETGGYDEILVGGEDPELSRRIRLSGWKILQLDKEMTRHDLAMTRLSQYWKRCYRSGYAFAAVTDRFAGKGNGFWLIEMRRILVRGGGSLALLLLAVGLFVAGHDGFALLSVALGTALLLFPRLFRVDYFQRSKQLNRSDARRYAWHCSLIVIPDLFGVLRYGYGKLVGKPLRNRRRKLATNNSERR